MNVNKWIKLNTSNLKGKTIAITGSTGGLAKHLVKTLASLDANFIFINRNKSKTEKQIQELTSLYPNIDIEFISCDLSNFESVKTATDIMKNRHIDFLYLASGAYNIKRNKTSLGFDNIFQINFVSQYYMIKELLPQLNKVEGKIVAISSIANSYSKIDTNDIDFFTRKKASKVYGNAKRLLTFALQELMQTQQTTLSIVHPGVTLTNMTNHYPKAINWLVKIAIKLFFPSPQKAILSLVKGIFENTTYHEWIGPKIFNIWGKPKKQKIKNISNVESKKIFEIAEDIYINIKKTL